MDTKAFTEPGPFLTVGILLPTVPNRWYFHCNVCVGPLTVDVVVGTRSFQSWRRAAGARALDSLGFRQLKT